MLKQSFCLRRDQQNPLAKLGWYSQNITSDLNHPHAHLIFKHGREIKLKKNIKNKLGQRQSQTPFSSAFWVQKDFELTEGSGPKKF